MVLSKAPINLIGYKHLQTRYKPMKKKKMNYEVSTIHLQKWIFRAAGTYFNMVRIVVLWWA